MHSATQQSALIFLFHQIAVFHNQAMHGGKAVSFGVAFVNELSSMRKASRRTRNQCECAVLWATMQAARPWSMGV